MGCAGLFEEKGEVIKSKKLPDRRLFTMPFYLIIRYTSVGLLVDTLFLSAAFNY